MSYRKDTNMWRERIIEAKKAQGISVKTMSERTGGHLPEKTITRILNGGTEFPRIDTILELGQSVGLSAQEVFAETNTVATDYDLAKLQATYEAQMADKDLSLQEMENIETENSALRAIVSELKAEIILLEEKLALKDEIIHLHNRYISYIESMKG